MIKNIFNKPYYLDWLFYYVIITSLGYLQSVINAESDFEVFFILIGVFIFIGIPVIIRYNLKNIRKKDHQYFISFSTNDRLIVEFIINKLNKSTPATFWIQSNIDIGENFTNEIESAINKSSGSIIFLSNNFQNSKFIQEFEIDLLFNKYNDGNFQIIPILLDKIENKKDYFFDDIQFVRGNSKSLYRSSTEEYKEIVDELREIIINETKHNENKPLSVFLKVIGWIIVAIAFTGQFVSDEIINFFFFMF